MTNGSVRLSVPRLGLVCGPLRFELDPANRADGEARTYEERITLWQADDLDAAIELAEVEAQEYCAAVDASYLGLAQASKADLRAQGAELFSLIRDSHLDPDDYLDRFFDAGTEYQQTTR